MTQATPNLKAARPLIEVPMKEWGGSVFVRKLSARELVAFSDTREELKKTKDSLAEVRLLAKAVAKHTLTADGDRMFTDDQEEDLLDQPLDTLKELSEAIFGGKTEKKSEGAAPASV